MNPVWALVPLKDFESAKTRLAVALGADARRELALAMARDVARALACSRAIARVILVSDIADLADQIGVPGIACFDTRGARGLNADLSLAAGWAHAQGAARVLIAHADLPRMTAAAIDRFVLKATPSVGVRAAACKHGTGTNLLLAPLPLPLPLVFGRDSLARFGRGAAARGIALEVVRDPAIASDVDEPEDFRSLAAASVRGEFVGAATSTWLRSAMASPLQWHRLIATRAHEASASHL